MPFPNQHDLGDLVKVTAVFRDSDDDSLFDPDVVNLSFRNPTGDVTTWVYGTDAEVVKDSTGSYYALIDADEAGTWAYRWFSTGAGQAAEERTFTIAAATAIEE